jgi:hypothetical protein
MIRRKTIHGVGPRSFCLRAIRVWRKEYRSWCPRRERMQILNRFPFRSRRTSRSGSRSKATYPVKHTREKRGDGPSH